MNIKRSSLWMFFIVASLLTIFTGSCKKDTAETKVGVCPLVKSTNPANLDTNVNLNKIITVTFNEEMDPETIIPGSFTLFGTNDVPGTLTYDNTKATMSFTPDSLLKAKTTYKATVFTSVKDVTGNALQINYVWTFSTGEKLSLSPMVISTDPANNAKDVVLNKIVKADFNMPMDSSTITTATFTVKQGAASVAGTVSYNGTTASFTPNSNLLSGTTYTATITTGAKNTLGTPLLNDYIWTFTTGSVVAPMVISTDPINNAKGVVLNKIVKATFNMSMDPLTIGTATFTVKQGTALVAGTVSYSGTTATFTPNSNFLSGTTYTATITTGAKNTLGTPLSNDFVWTFTTISLTAPMVISTDPANNATGVVLNKIVKANFNMPMDPLTISTATFTVKQGAIPVAGTVSYSGTTASFTPNGNLLSGTTYTATVTTGAKNLAGIPIANDYVWTFTTVSITAPMVISTDPANNATGIATNKIVKANFNMPMDPLTISTATFTLKQGASPVAGTVSYSGTTASFTPNSNLLSGTTYTATITTGAKNLAGIPIANDYVWKFSTAAISGAPFVDLKSVLRFGIIAGVGVTNNAGFSEIHDMDVGISPGVRSSITGFPPAKIFNGAIYASDDIAPPGVAAMLTQAKKDLTEAYLFAEGATSPAPATVSGDLGGKTLAPGIYKTTSTLLIQSGDLTLDAQGNPNAVWIFQIKSDFTTVGGAGGSVILSGGAQAKNVFWQTGSSATIGDGTSFKGNVLALTSITMNSGAKAVGRMLARNGAVVLTNTNIINKP